MAEKEVKGKMEGPEAKKTHLLALRAETMYFAKHKELKGKYYLCIY